MLFYGACQLKTDGSYKFVRNPCYFMFLFGCMVNIKCSWHFVSYILYLDNTCQVKNFKLAKYFSNVVFMASGVSFISCSIHFMITFQIAPILNAII